MTPLEALKEIREKTDAGFIYDYHSREPNPLNIIETALKKLEMFEEISNLPIPKYSQEDIEIENNKQKQLKALEIIKEKEVDIHILKNAIKSNDIHKYNARFENCAQLTQAEFDLLKEVLL